MRNPLIYGEFAVDPDIQKAVELWQEYYGSTEAFDRMICFARNDRGIAIPVYGEEIRACSQNARQVMARVTRRANELGISDETWRSAQRIALRLTR